MSAVPGDDDRLAMVGVTAHVPVNHEDLDVSTHSAAPITLHVLECHIADECHS